jgi:hypothetical protein
MKMPEPMMPPMTIITASKGPKARLNGWLTWAEAYQKGNLLPCPSDSGLA